jgi:hypothetical protein
MLRILTELADLPVVPSLGSGIYMAGEIQDVVDHIIRPFDEGIVVTAIGEHSSVSRRAKVVRESFKETKPPKVRPAPGQFETSFAQQFVTEVRVDKMKVTVAELRGKPYSNEFTGELLNRVYDDVLVEEIVTIDRKVRKAGTAFNFADFKRLVDQEVKGYLS